MTKAKKIIVIGGTGYAGSAIVREAVKRQHLVTSISRSEPKEPIDGVEYIISSTADNEIMVNGFDVVVGALSPRGSNVGTLAKTYENLAIKAAVNDARLILVGGFSCLRPALGEPRMIEAGGFPEGTPEEIIVEAKENMDVLNNLLKDSTGVDWLFVSPALEFSSWTPGEDLGYYRVGDDVALFDENGKSAISGIDYARAILDEIENPKKHRVHIGIAY
ncbi:NAD(P)-dependent oxidoreductase [Musicola paradisiaca]|uniref:NAD-dependent epimerase/dehydratase n=1 Tax=Musicola paradisiaca (strain Ech703) TaxID=579405 RepID=C6C943_MUSP7|nr:NAD(P)H-binding protein [Musicola paradisiaca]ACS86243.1 NAD-dependent epimerase/dehydratase [Musicola paradisiaca Ech703]